MPKSSRDYLKRQTAQIYLGMDRTMTSTLELKTIFEPDHPDLAIGLDVVLQACLACQEILRKFWSEAWGQEDPRWESWI